MYILVDYSVLEIIVFPFVLLKKIVFLSNEDVEVLDFVQECWGIKIGNLCKRVLTKATWLR